MVPKLFFSQTLNPLLDRLLEQIEPTSPLDTKTIVISNSGVRQWLLLEIAKRKGIAMGLKLVTIDQLFPSKKGQLELFCSIYSALQMSQDLELLSYLDGKKKRLLNLSSQLSALFSRYAEYPALIKEEKSWQHELFKKVLPPQDLKVEEEIICFGIDYLPQAYWQALGKAPSLSIYLFSPCVEFWEDLCTNRERRQLTKKAPQIARQELDAYLQNGPRNLANWGRLGRKTLQQFDLFESEELYSPLERTSLLTTIQHDLLTFEETVEPPVDNSIQIHLTGSSRLREIEALKKEILKLDIPYHEISVLAPDIGPYIPLIEYVFQNIPYSISKCDVASQSFFRQGLIRLLQLGKERWGAEEILTLFETPSFSRKRGWDRETLEIFRKWISSARIDWGIDADHRQNILQELLGPKEFIDEGSWEKGLDTLLEAILFFKPIQVNADLFEELLSTLLALKELDLRGEKTLKNWSESLEKAARLFLAVDPEDAGDSATLGHFQHLLLEMRKCPDEGLYPFDVVEHFLNQPCMAHMNGSKLHSVRFGSIQEGALIPAKAVFLIGMDEMSFPKMAAPSSLDLLKGQIPTRQDFDRYSFLQCIFSASDFLRISYGHLSPDEGKPVGPSLLVQELIDSIGPEIARIYPPIESVEMKKNLNWPKLIQTELPSGELTLPIHELRQLARHPWRFYLQKAEKIYLNEELEETFALQKGKAVRELFEKELALQANLPRPFHSAMRAEVEEKVAERREQLEEWQIDPFTLIFRENCKEGFREGGNYVVPPLELRWENLKIGLIGEIKQVSFKGMISLYEDNISSTLKIWPEAMAVALAIGAKEILFLRSGKIRGIENPEEHLKAFVEYYFHAKLAPSPLLSEWADPILRKGALELAKKMERGTQFEEPVMDWVFARTEIPSAEEVVESWGPLLKETFEGLQALYPSRGNHAKV